MSKVLTDNTNYKNIADAIRYMGVEGTFKPGDMAGAIKKLSPYRRLPEAYQEVEYLESTGVQWIDTGVNVQNMDQYYVKFSTSNAGSTITGVNGTTIYQNYTFGILSEETFNFWSGDYNVRYIEWTADTIYEFEQKDNEYYIINGAKSSFSGATYDKLNVTMPIFTLYYEGSYQSYSKTKLYNYKIYNNNSLVRDFIPCYRKSDNKPGLYDLVNDEFYVNQGTGDDFNIGVPVYCLPAEYQQVEYLQSTGVQYIDTGIQISTALSLKIKLSDVGYGSFYVSKSASIFGSISVSSWMFSSTYYQDQTPHPFRFHAISHDYYDYDVGDIVEGKHYTLTYTQSMINCNGTNGHYENTDKTWADTTGTNLTLWRGGMSLGYSKYKLYNCYIYDNDTIVRNFIPCYRISDSKPGLYDIANSKFYVNQGTGDDFTVGPDIN